MDGLEESVIPETQTTELLDAEIRRVRDRIKTLSTRRNALTSALLSSQRIRSLVPSDDAPSIVCSAGTETVLPNLSALLAAHNHRSKLATRRAALSTTFFVTHDPDPRAPSGKRALRGIRIERYSRTTRKFLTPSYVFLQRVSGGNGDEDHGNNTLEGNDDTAREDSVRDETAQKTQWRVHRHTLPPSIPLQKLTARYLPLPPSPTTEDEDEDDDDDGAAASATDPASKQGPPPRQDLARFVCALRREVVGLLRRQEAIERLSTPGAVLAGQEGAGAEGGGAAVAVASAEAVNAEATDVRLRCADGEAARIRIGKAGGLERVVVRRRNGERNARRERAMMARGRVEGLVLDLI